jgi:hypothetical protein
VKIALITYWFYPNTIVAARRFRNIQKELAGYPELQMDVFTGSFNLGVYIQDRFPVDLTNIKYIKLHKNSFEKNIFAGKNAFFHLLNRTIFLGAAERRFGREILRHKQLESYDIIYLSLGPFSSLLNTAYRLKKRYPEKKILIEYRDEWVDGAVHYAARHHLVHPYSRWKSYFRELTDYLSHRGGNQLEKKVLPVCDGIVVISREMIRHFIDRIPELAPENFIFLPNGISDNEIAELRRVREERKCPQGNKLRILYAGTLFGAQDIRPFLNALDELLETGIVAREDFEIEIFGRYNPGGERWPERLKKLVRWRGEFPRNAIYREYFAHDLLLFIIGDWPKSEITMTGKIFELIESGQPILALLPMSKDGCARHLLEKTNAAYIKDINNRESIKETILDLLDQKNNDGKIRTERKEMDWFYRQYHYKNICRRLYESCFKDKIDSL